MRHKALVVVWVSLSGCASVTPPPAAAPTVAAAVADPRAQDAQAAREIREALERWQDAVSLWHLTRVRELRMDAYGWQLAVQAQLRDRVANGIARRIELEATAASLADDEIQLRRDDARQREAALRFCLRHGVAVDSLEVPLKAVTGATSGHETPDPDLLRETQDAHRMAEVLGELHEKRVRSLEAVGKVQRQMYEIGQIRLDNLRAAQETLVDARVQAILARAEVALAEGRLAALRGTLGRPPPAAPGACMPAAPLDPAAVSIPPVAEAIPAAAQTLAPAPAPTAASASAAASPPPPARRAGAVSRARVRTPARTSGARKAPKEILASADPFAELEPAGASPQEGAELRRTRSTALQCPAAGAQAIATSADGWPAFDWPPPAPTTTASLPPRLVRPATGAGMLEAVADRLHRVLKQLGYPATFLSVPEGFALLTRMERILDDGSTSPDPWSRDLPRVGELGFGDFVRALFQAPPGRYRVIAFVVTNQAYPTGRSVLTAQRFDALMCAGFNRAPPALARIPYQAGTTTADALIYEFSKPRNDAPAAFLASTTIQASEHLQRSGITDALGAVD